MTTFQARRERETRYGKVNDVGVDREIKKDESGDSARSGPGGQQHTRGNRIRETLLPSYVSVRGRAVQCFVVPIPPQKKE